MTSVLHVVYRSTLPVWEEMVIFNENFNYLTQEDPKVMIFFEVGTIGTYLISKNL